MSGSKQDPENVVEAIRSELTERLSIEANSQYYFAIIGYEDAKESVMTQVWRAKSEPDPEMVVTIIGRIALLRRSRERNIELLEQMAGIDRDLILKMEEEMYQSAQRGLDNPAHPSASVLKVERHTDG